MTFSRPAIERLIATVESGLQYGELGPYAQALKMCLEELDHATAEGGDHLSKMSRRFCDTILNDRDALRAEVARLTAERDAMRETLDNLRDEVKEAGR
jgi:hypothetical protein